MFHDMLAKANQIEKYHSEGRKTVFLFYIDVDCYKMAITTRQYFQPGAIVDIEHENAVYDKKALKMMGVIIDGAIHKQIQYQIRRLLWARIQDSISTTTKGDTQ